MREHPPSKSREETPKAGRDREACLAITVLISSHSPG